MIDAQRVRRDVASLADRRPDLIALQYGYRSEDAKLRQAILSQFPNLTIGLVGGRDSSSIYSFGPQASFELPVFNRNEGAIALEQATREALNREFNARLTAAAGEIGALQSEQALLARQLAGIEPRLKEARLIAVKAEAAFKQGLFDERAYVDTQVALLMREEEKIGVERALLDGQVELATLIGAGMPPGVNRPGAAARRPARAVSGKRSINQSLAGSGEAPAQAAGDLQKKCKSAQSRPGKTPGKLENVVGEKINP